MTATDLPANTTPGRVGQIMERAHRWLEVVERAVGGLLIATVLAMVVLQAAQRYLPVSGWAWTGELARYALVWLTFALAGHLAGRGEHIGLEVVDYLVRGRLLHAIRRLADAIVAIAAAAFTVDAWHLMTGATGRTTPVMSIPLAVVYLMPVAGFALTTVRAGWAALIGRPEPAAAAGDPVTEAGDPA